MDAITALQDYLDTMAYSKNLIRISHANQDGGDAGYSYWFDCSHENPSGLCWKVSAKELFDLGEAILSEDGKVIDFDGVKIPVEADYKKLRRRIEDYLRKSPNNKVFEVAVYLGIKLD